MRAICRCPLHGIRSNCPFDYANGWHEMRRQVLLRTEISPETQDAIVAARAKMSDNELESLPPP